MSIRKDSAIGSQTEKVGGPVPLLILGASRLREGDSQANARYRQG
jgi:hypothetical protein